MTNLAGKVLNFLWIIDFEYEPRLHHGAYLRYFNLASELVSQGHTVTFAVNFLDRDSRSAAAYLQQLKEQGVFTDFVEANFAAPVWRIRISAQLIYPGLANHILRPAHRECAARIDGIARGCGAEIILISSVRYLFLPEESKSGCEFVYDLCDSRYLQAQRGVRLALQKPGFHGLAPVLKAMAFAYASEHYYSCKPVLKIIVSRVDKEAIDKISGRPGTSVVLLNGVRDGIPKGRYAKIPGRIILTGNMDFPPNYEAALWFLDHVFPLVLKQRPDACFVIAGANPVSRLRKLARKNVLVTGYVEDLNREIASSEIFVAPMVSGGGFKNKVVEAIVNRTSVVATSLAVEFLDPEIRSRLAVADSPGEIVAAIMAIWQDAKGAETRADALHDMIVARFSWGARASELAQLAESAVHQSGRCAG